MATGKETTHRVLDKGLRTETAVHFKVLRRYLAAWRAAAPKAAHERVRLARFRQRRQLDAEGRQKTPAHTQRPDRRRKTCT